MKPIAVALDVIQGEMQAYLGCLIPIITAVKRKLVALKGNLPGQAKLKYADPVVDALIAALDKRFEGLFADEACLMSTAFHPYFRLGWINPLPDVRNGISKPIMQKKMESHVQAWLEQETQEKNHEGPGEVSSGDEMEMESPEGLLAMCAAHGTPRDNSSSAKSRATVIVRMWLGGKASSSFSNEVFNNEASLIDLFLKFNTGMPSSAAVERLFSLGKDIARAKRNRLADNTFDTLMFLKGNSTTLREVKKREEAQLLLTTKSNTTRPTNADSTD